MARPPALPVAELPLLSLSCASAIAGSTSQWARSGASQASDARSEQEVMTNSWHPRRKDATGALLVLGWLATAAPLGAQTPITLEEALREARRANASLPVAGIDTLEAAAGLREARGALWPRLGLDGDVHEGTPSKYASADARLQAILDVPIYDGGRLRAEVNTARAGRDLSRALYRIAAADLDLEVRICYSAIVQLEQERNLLSRGLERLERYQDLIAARKGSGEPVAADLLKTQVRLDTDTANLHEFDRQLAGFRLSMNELLGRDPADSLVFAPLPPPSPPGPAEVRPWEETPDLRASRLAQRQQASRIDAVRAERRPQLDLSANVGTEPVIGSEGRAPLNTGQGAGTEVVLSLIWPLWDRGIYRSRLQQAELSARRAAQETTVSRRQVRLDWNQARTDLECIYRQVQIWDHAVPVAEEAYLLAESSYRGGYASTLDVLDAFDQWIQAGRSAAQAAFAYREAEARAIRWGTP